MAISIFFTESTFITPQSHVKYIFMTSRSTVSNLLVYKSYLCQGFATSSQVDSVYTDTRKAFNKVHILLCYSSTYKHSNNRLVSKNHLHYPGARPATGNTATGSSPRHALLRNGRDLTARRPRRRRGRAGARQRVGHPTALPQVALPYHQA